MTDVSGELTFSHVADVPLMVTRSVSSPASKRILPVFQFTPIEGSPALVAIPAGGPSSGRFGKQMLKKQTEQQKAAENTSGGSCARDVSLKKLAAETRGSNMPPELWHYHYRSLVINDAAPWRRDGGLLRRRGVNFLKWAYYKSQVFSARGAGKV